MNSILITGGSGGIGRAIARAFARDGYAVAVQYNTGADRAAALVTELRDMGAPAFAVRCDVSDSADVAAMFAAVEAEIGAPAVLVNNAGIAEQSLFTDITDEMWRRMIDVNLGGVFNCARAALPAMIRRGRGAIINISSMWGQVGASCEVHYSAAKAGVIGLTKALAKEVAPSGITVNAVAPGAIRTDMLSSFTEADLAALAEEIPMGRLGEPEEIAHAVRWLADATYVTGQVIGVNGGMVTGG